MEGTNLRFATLALLVLTACGHPAQDLIAGAKKFRDQMCACADRACIDGARAAYRAWQNRERVELADRAESAADYQVDEHALDREIEACETRVATSLLPSPVDASEIDAAPTDADAPLPPAMPIDVGAAIRSATDWAKTKRDGTLGSIRVNYIDSDGALDADDGEIQLRFGIGPTDDPNRKTGKPIKHPDFSPQCFSLVLAHGAWKTHDISCGSTFTNLVACSPPDVWKRALADSHKYKDELTKDSLAVIELTSTSHWTLRVDDELRKVHVFRVYPDDCPISVEQAPN